MSMPSITTWTFEKNEPLFLANKYADLEGTALLYSGGTLDSAQNSYLCLLPEEKVVIHAHSKCWEELEDLLGPFDQESSLPKWVGYLGYEMGCYADLEESISHFSSPVPDALFYRPSIVIHFDHKRGQATHYGNALPQVKNRQIVPSTLQTTFQSPGFIDQVTESRKLLLEGEIYQVNLSQEFHLEGRCDPFNLFNRLNHLNPAPFSAFLQAKEFALVSSSPERFLKKRGSYLETRPIKGTAPRGKTQVEDQHNREELVKSPKERSELLMITDLMRNDLGKVSEPGSVRVKEIWRCETYANVFHLVSIIEGKSREKTVGLIRKLFPGGSITGCPKGRAMQAISALEKRPRGVYTGSIGYFAQNGDCDFNIAIRTLVVHTNYVQVQLGSAIGIDSEPIREFKETLYKGESLFKVLEADEFCIL